MGYDPKPTDFSGFSVMSPSEREISFRMRRNNIIEHEAAEREALEDKHRAELEMEQRRHEQLLAKLQAENESRIRSIQAQAEQSAQADKQQRTQMTKAMVAAERRRAEFQRMSAQRMQHQRDTNIQAALATLRHENSMLFRENRELKLISNSARNSPRDSPYHSPSSLPYDAAPPSPQSNALALRNQPRESPLFHPREALALPPPVGNNSPPQLQLASPALIDRPATSLGYRPGHSRSASANHAFPRSSASRESLTHTQDANGYLMPSGMGRRGSHSRQASAPSSPLYHPAQSRPGSPAMGSYFDQAPPGRSGSPAPGVRFADHSASHSPGYRPASPAMRRMPESHQLPPAPSQGHGQVYHGSPGQSYVQHHGSPGGATLYHQGSPRHSPSSSMNQMQLAPPPSGHQYQHPRQLSLPFSGSQEQSTSSGRRPSRDMLLPPPPPRPSSRNATSNPYSGVYGYPSQDSAHARALADALVAERSGKRSRVNSNNNYVSARSGFNTGYATPAYY